MFWVNIFTDILFRTGCSFLQPFLAQLHPPARISHFGLSCTDNAERQHLSVCLPESGRRHSWFRSKPSASSPSPSWNQEPKYVRQNKDGDMWQIWGSSECLDGPKWIRESRAEGFRSGARSLGWFQSQVLQVQFFILIHHKECNLGIQSMMVDFLCRDLNHKLLELLRAVSVSTLISWLINI